MVRQRQPDDDESAHDPPGQDRCALLDEYWAALGSDSAAELRQKLIDRDRPADSIAVDLDVLDKLHQARCAARDDRESSQHPTTWLAKSFAMQARTRPGGTGAEPAPQRKAAQPAVDQPERIGKYIVVAMLDGGGQAELFRVVHPELANEWVLKLSRRPIAMEDEAGRNALKREGRLLAQCEHPNLVRVFDQDVHEGRRFVVMDYVKGLTLQQFVARHRPNPRRAAQLVIELARAVTYLHDRGITHQDIKPQNVLIDDQGRPRLIDLGLARQNHAWCDDADDWIGGTTGYMSPEQAMGSAALVGPRTDVFGLGSLLYHLLTGRALYVASSPASARRLAREGEPIRARQLNSGVPRSLERICRKALAREPERRYGSAFELERALTRSLKGRRMVVASLTGLATLTAAVLFFIPRPTQRPANADSALIPPAEAPRAATPSTPVAPKIVSFEVERFRGGALESLGAIGLTQLTRVDDGVRVSARLDAPAYCYLIALDANGEVHSCPPKENNPPAQSQSICYPSEIANDLGLGDAPGEQAFILVAATRPLPSCEEWEGLAGLTQRWKPALADGVWRYDGQRISREMSADRSEPREHPECPSAFQAICNYLKTRTDVETFQAIAFPVKDKSEQKKDGKE